MLALAKPSAERIYMGKPLGRHDSRQVEVHELLVRKAREGKMVVRLKGGDPYVFGRGGEEAEYLADQGVPFEVIPGITSAFAAPLSAGIAVTHRDAASSVAVVTGHEATKDHERVRWSSLVGVDTLVFLMGVSNVDVIARTLIAHGRDPETPAAMIQMAFWPDERSVDGTLATIAAEVAEAGIRPPATLVVGEVVRMRAKLLRAQRDLRRRAGRDSRFEPAPAPDQLLRLAAAGIGSKVLGFALDIGLFDRLEAPAPGRSLAEQMGVDSEALAEVLEALVALGLLEKGAEGYRNLDLASRYLREASPQSLRTALLHQARIASEWDDLTAYVRSGCPDYVPFAHEAEHQASCEILARFAAPAVAEKLDLVSQSPVLVVGYGGEAYREAFSARWPGIAMKLTNPFAGGNVPLSVAGGLQGEGPRFGAILLSGILASAGRGEVRQALEGAAARLRDGGLLALHDTFLPAGALPPPEAALGALGRRMRRGGCRDWSIGRLEEALEEIGFRGAQFQVLHAGTTLVTARRG